jgi:hypothetical protein
MLCSSLGHPELWVPFGTASCLNEGQWQTTTDALNRNGEQPSEASLPRCLWVSPALLWARAPLALSSPNSPPPLAPCIPTGRATPARVGASGGGAAGGGPLGGRRRSLGRSPRGPGPPGWTGMEPLGCCKSPLGWSRPAHYSVHF